MTGANYDSTALNVQSERWRVALALLVLTSVFAAVRYLRAPEFTSDLDQLWYAAHALVRGQNPYQVVGPGKSFEWAFPLFYPLPAILLAVPFSWVPVAVARLAFSLISAGVLGYAIGPRWRVLWPLVPSASYYLAITRNQWSPLILATVWIPALGFLLSAKPNVGALAVVSQDKRSALRVAAGVTVMVLASFLVRPTWFGEWMAIVRSLPNQRVAILQPGGFLLLAALLLWRTADGRVLLATAVLPLTPSLYDALPLFMLCRTLRQALVLSALTHLTQWLVIAGGPYDSGDMYYLSMLRLSVWLIFLPSLAIALMNRVARRLPEAISSDDGHTIDARAQTPWLDRFLASGVVLSLALQLWLVFGL